MFDYKAFKEEMSKRGHEVHKKGKYITIEPNNNYKGYAKGFIFATEILGEFDKFLSLVHMDHYNTWIYTAKFKII